MFTSLCLRVTFKVILDLFMSVIMSPEVSKHTANKAQLLVEINPLMKYFLWCVFNENEG